MATKQDSPTGTIMVPTRSEVDALRRATLHAFRESLRWAADTVNVDGGGDIEDLAYVETAIRSFDRTGRLLDQLGWQPHHEGVNLTESDDYLCGLCVLALAYDAHESHFLLAGHADALDGLTAKWPTLNEEEAWKIVFEGDAS